MDQSGTDSGCVAARAGLRQRIFAWALARFNGRYEAFVSGYKQRLVGDLVGTVLEIGPGAGANLQYMKPSRVRWIGLEPNPFMHPYLQAEAARLGLPVELISGAAGNLPFAANSVDAVIGTLVLCCVSNQQQTLREVLRVLKPTGKFVFIEHVAAPAGTRLRRIQNLITPVWKRLGDNCHPNRDTLAEVQRAGFAGVTHQEITAPMPVVSPQIVGVAVKSREP